MNRIILTSIMAVVLFAGCTSSQKSGSRTDASSQVKTPKKNDNAVLSSIMDEAVGGQAGVVISGKMDVQAKKMEADLGKTAKVERVGEGIKLTFNTQLLFDFNKTELKMTNKADLQKLAETLMQNPETDMLIVGHTDDIGTESSNLELSEKRANAVANQLISAGVDIKRMKIQGWGESQPSVLNNSENNRSQNRRVEIAIFANDKMKKEAGA